MIRHFLLLWIGCLFLPAAVRGSQLPENLTVAFNKNAELLGFAYFLGFEGPNIENETVVVGETEIPKSEWHNYGYRFYQKYQSYASSEHLASAFAVADHLWLDYILTLLLQVDDFPNARLLPEIKESYYINFSQTQNPEEARENVIVFLEGLNRFYTEVQFDQYLAESAKYYEAARSEVRDHLTDTDFIAAMEDFYERSFTSYTLLPSLTIPKGMGYGLQYTRHDTTRIFNLFGAFIRQEFEGVDTLRMGFADSERLRELSVHEFGHSFVNPVVDGVEEELVSGTEVLFEPIQSDMSDQGYVSWQACLYEHFVRAGEVVLARKLNRDKRSGELRSWYVDGRKFIYLPVIIEELEDYERGLTITYAEAVTRAMNELNRLK